MCHSAHSYTQINDAGRRFSHGMLRALQGNAVTAFNVINRIDLKSHSWFWQSKLLTNNIAGELSSVNGAYPSFFSGVLLYR